MEYAGPFQIQVKDGLVEKISSSPVSKEPLYILPGFCDSHVTLGANSLGGWKERGELEADLKQFLLHGFTNLQSIADPPWASELSEIRKKNSQYPRLFVLPPVLLAGSKELPTSKVSGYKILKSPEEAISSLTGKKGKIHLFLRHNKEEAFEVDGKLLYRMRSEAEKNGLELSVSTFGEEFANWEALSSETKVLFHPIPETSSIRPVAHNLVKQIWAPLLGIYFTRKEIGTPTFAEEWEKWTDWSPTFKERALSKDVLSTFPSLSESEKQEADKEYESYLAFLRARKNLSLRILLGSGAGHQLQFPGISGWKELRILSDLLGPKEALRAATETTCQYLGASHEGKIRVGKPAHLLIFREDPIQNWDKLKTLRTVVTERVKTEISSPEKKKTKSGKKEK
nr:amidohydrolase family protein [Leptospira sarikeiensis]